MGDGNQAGEELPREGRLLGLDYGQVRIGVAVSTYEQNIASPLENYDRRDDAVDAAFLKRMAEEYQIVGIVVGLPVHMSGDEGGSARKARDFGEWVARKTELPVAYWDERFTSVLAEARLLEAGLSKDKRKARRDKLAAMYLLQSYLDAVDRTQAPGEYDEKPDAE